MEPKGSWSEGFKQGKAKGCFDLRDAKQRAKDAEMLLKRAMSQLADLTLMEDVDEFFTPNTKLSRGPE